MPFIYHIATKIAWSESAAKGFYEHPSLDAEGFIHCSEDRQVPGVVKRYFEGQTNLVKLTIDTEKLTSKLVFDWSSSMADTFPHIYGPVNLDAVVGITSIR